MADVHGKETRSRNMSAVRSKNTHPEIIVRKILHKAGFRFRIHPKHIIGKPDIVLARFKAIIFVNGCFWHGHDCHLFKVPATRPAFWLNKIYSNKRRDLANLTGLQNVGWRTCIVWECALRGKYRIAPQEFESRLANWLRSDQQFQSVGAADSEVTAP